ncbi:hypothetical protein NQ314_018999 [Rhamnusium bicolor]|uniref:Peptidase S1 domain-containing protein n=1 Tax=Rhamnusium bicolor TaxID=1586634 RepID=A0AAV8WQ39_9CUCU|nr:hypothetical protein NQ314_018999 [Rhamnusium bicolor]
MKLITVILLVTVAFAQAERNWDEIFPRHLPDPPHSLLPHGIPSPRITGGEEAEPHSRPFQVGLFIPVSGGTAFCGGSIISPIHILTAAHCVDSVIGGVEIVLGAHNIRRTEPTQLVVVSSNITVHRDWSSSTIRNDIAYITLPEPVEFNEYIQPIGLPLDDRNNFNGDTAVASGWGLSSDSATTISEILRVVDFPIISNTVCNIAYLGNIHPTNICASGSGGKSTCNGDSGGPLTVDDTLVNIHIHSTRTYNGQT